MSRRAVRAAALGSLALGLAASPCPAAAVTGDLAILQGLDKVTARISTFEAPVGRRVRFGALDIHVRHCRKTPPEEPPETTVFLEIDEVRRGEPPARLFGGWMFASSPALSALEHPVYDVWVLDCRTASTSPGSTDR